LGQSHNSKITVFFNGNSELPIVVIDRERGQGRIGGSAKEQKCNRSLSCCHGSSALYSVRSRCGIFIKLLPFLKCCAKIHSCQGTRTLYLSIKSKKNCLLFSKRKDYSLLFFSALPHQAKCINGAISTWRLFLITPLICLAITNRIIGLLHTDNIDVIDLKRASPLIKFSVAKNGIIIYEKKQGIFSEFSSLAFRMYIDTKKLRDAQEKAIKYFLDARGLS